MGNATKMNCLLTATNSIIKKYNRSQQNIELAQGLAHKAHNLGVSCSNQLFDKYFEQN